MKTLILFSVLLGSFPAFARTIIVKPGNTRDITIQEFRSANTQNLVINCEPELKCSIKHDYVGKYFKLMMPNNQVYKKYKKQEDAMNGAQFLISSKVCDRLELLESKEQNKNY